MRSNREQLLATLYKFRRSFLLIESWRTNPDLNRLTFLTVIRRGNVVLDIGANIGTWTRAFAHIVGSNGLVYAFEPASATCQSLIDRSAHLPHVRVIPAGIGAETCEAELVTPAGDQGQASLFRHSSGSWAHPGLLRTERVRILRLDDFVVDAGLSKVDFVKVDIEGGEMSLLDGAERTLTKFKPLIYMELNDAWLSTIGSSSEAVVRRMRALGYNRVLRPTIFQRGKFGFQRGLSEPPVNGDFLFSTDAF
jgi:FkbM family methyltransferase